MCGYEYGEVSIETHYSYSTSLRASKSFQYHLYVYQAVAIMASVCIYKFRWSLGCL